ncbi:hypothetical protein ACJMK2_039604 [Sinanodonta woodiana]|uniref:Uncharacterized protein n=1 Tax=Sinanodonta woodiana TaxID=1069815 RepID=A0ABD3WGH5_SINWO
MSSNRELEWEIQEAQWEREYLDDDGTADLQCQLLEAIRGRNVKKFKRIIDFGIDTHFVDDFGSSPLHIAVNQPSSAKLQEIIHILVYFGTSLHQLDRFGRTALHIAARTSANYVMTLLEAGCKTDVQDNAGRTPLMEACSCDSKESLAILQYLLDRKANIHIIDCDGMTAWCIENIGKKLDLNTIRPDELSGHLRRFYAEAQPKNVSSRVTKMPANQAQEYHKNSLKNVRAAINRYLKDNGKDIDIVKDKEFKNANSMLNAKLKI